MNDIKYKKINFSFFNSSLKLELKYLTLQWENHGEPTKQGLFRIDDVGTLKKIDISDIENEDFIEWEYIRHNLDAVRMPLSTAWSPRNKSVILNWILV